MTQTKTCSCEGKSLDHFLQPAILALLATEDLHGFAMVKAIGENAMFHGTPPDSTGVYRFLKKMHEQGLVTATDVDQEHLPAKRCYHLTAKGRVCLASRRRTLHAYIGDLARFVSALDALELED